MNKMCPECNSRDLFFTTDVASAGGYGPALLPGLGGFFFSAKMTVVACKQCGLIRYFASPEARAKLDTSSKWKRLDCRP